jgi:hypothetical protein
MRVLFLPGKADIVTQLVDKIMTDPVNGGLGAMKAG